MKKILTTLVLILIAELSFSQNFYTERKTLWGQINITLRVVGYEPQEEDTIVGMQYSKFYDLTDRLPALIMFKIRADSIMIRQESIIKKQEKIILNLEKTNKNTRRTWIKRGVGLSVGGLAVGLTVGLILPMILK